MARRGGSIDHIDRTLAEEGKDSLAQKDAKITKKKVPKKSAS
jgi:hypothetical protein